MCSKHKPHPQSLKPAHEKRFQRERSSLRIFSFLFSFFFFFITSHLWIIDDEKTFVSPFRFDPLPFSKKDLSLPLLRDNLAERVSEITFFLLVAACLSRTRPGRKEWREDRRSSFLFALLWGPNNASRSYSSKRDFP